MANENSLLESFESLAVGSDWKKPEEPDPINVPIFASSTFKTSSVDHAEELALGKVRVLNLTESFHLLSAQHRLEVYILLSVQVDMVN